MSGFRTSQFRVLASGLEYPEGPVYQSDGGVLLVEIHKGTLTRVNPDGTTQTVANLGGGPNGAAVGPDGAIYVCNDGGLAWMQIPPTTKTLELLVPTGQPPNYIGGSTSGSVATRLPRCTRNAMETGSAVPTISFLTLQGISGSRIGVSKEPPTVTSPLSIMPNPTEVRLSKRSPAFGAKRNRAFPG